MTLYYSRVINCPKTNNYGCQLPREFNWHWAAGPCLLQVEVSTHLNIVSVVRVVAHNYTITLVTAVRTVTSVVIITVVTANTVITVVTAVAIITVSCRS